MKTKAFVVNEPGKGNIRSYVIPELKPNEILVKVKACGICTTDRRIFGGKINVPLPVIGGHEVSGEVVKLGKDVNDINIGDHAALDTINRCGHCFYCVRGMDNLCVNSRKGRKLEDTFLIAGGFSEFVIVKRKQTFVVDRNTNFEELSLSEPLACCIHSVKKASLAPGDTVLIFGGGTMGVLHAMVANAFGALPIISEPSNERRSFVSSLGIKTIKPDECDETSKTVNKGLGFDAVFITAPVARVINNSLNYVRKMGTVVIYTSLHPSTDLSFDINMLHYSEINITGTEGRTMEDFREATMMISKSITDISPLVTKTIKLNELEDELKIKPEGNAQRTVVLPQE
ncbi:MAG: alcohol dehydrogenase catalytic domain-containing protein [Kosmotoga sp.]|nr:MAG: alcohol dehydrogenase catalytic domain-containing protein [Kosmotoga sp.]